MSDSKRALVIIFDHLEAQSELLPSLRFPQDFHGSGAQRSPPIAMIHTCLDGLDGAIKGFPDLSDEHKEEFFTLLRPRLTVLFRCLKFLMRYSPFLYVPPYLGRSQAAIRLTEMLKYGAQSTEDPDSLEQIVDFALAIWLNIAASLGEEGVAMSPEIYEDRYLIAYQPISQCICHDPSRTILVQKIDALDHKSLESLVEFFRRQCHLWPTVYREQYQQNPANVYCGALSHYVTGMMLLCKESDAFFKTISKSQVPNLMLSLAQEFSGGICTADDRNTSLPVEVASRLLQPRLLLADRAHWRIPEFLSRGLLDIITDSLLSALRTGSEPFEDWKPKSTASNPLKRLYYLAHHPRISKALIDAILSLPASVKDTLSADTGATGKLWNDFAREMKCYQDALDILEAGPLAICDCLEHDLDAEQSQDGPSVHECSWCQTAVYCSHQCQRADWEAFHRNECANSRVRRVDQEVHQFHISYRSRVFKLLHLQVMLNELGLTKPLSNQDWDGYQDGNHKKDIILFKATSLPVDTYHISAERAQTYTHMGFPLFNDDRVRAMIEQCERDEDAFFAASISSLGRYGVLTYGMFLEDFVDTDSDQRPLKRVYLTTGFMRVFDAAEGEAGYFNL
ncbi:hypothetical protein DFP72DRAFT_406478 [Ephemerocybe angulata]|uniref:MYND-type domain-containing protein n=1 Tax=Ephemerocybe angulata TaxID=980116 RepID=A0A8H6HX73_9AGAR|nr:hypothetical protein DFP72DRAFT_406478 [Tulosesus angulatus]